MHASGRSLCRHTLELHVLKYRSEFGIWRDAHGLISAGQPAFLRRFLKGTPIFPIHISLRFPSHCLKDVSRVIEERDGIALSLGDRACVLN